MRSTADLRRLLRCGGGFSLIEVIAAVAVFAIGMVAVLGLFTPVTRSVTSVTEAEAAARVADSVRARLEAMPFTQSVALIQSADDVQAKDGDPRYNFADTTKSSRVLFGKLNGEVGVYDASARNWRDSTDRNVAAGDRFFEIDLIRNGDVSPTMPLVAYTMRVRWPAYVRTASNAAKQAGQNPAGGAVPFDHGRKQAMFFTGAIRR